METGNTTLETFSKTKLPDSKKLLTMQSLLVRFANLVKFDHGVNQPVISCV